MEGGKANRRARAHTLGGRMHGGGGKSNSETLKGWLSRSVG